jgi:hypothetical protein
LAFWRPLLSDWQISGVITAMSGLPIDVVDSGAGSFYGLDGGSPLARPSSSTSSGHSRGRLIQLVLKMGF